jgi:hypothetical protein
MDVWMDIPMDGWIYLWMDGWMDVIAIWLVPVLE